MNIENRIEFSQEKKYEIEARKFFVENVFPSKIFQAYLRADTGICVFTEEDKNGNLILPQTEYDPNKKTGFLRENSQLNLENLSALSRLLLKWCKNESLVKRDIESAKYFSINKSEDYYDKIVEIYDQEKRKGRYLANTFLSIVKKGKKESKLFEKTFRKLNK